MKCFMKQKAKTLAMFHETTIRSSAFSSMHTLPYHGRVVFANDAQIKSDNGCKDAQIKNVRK